MFRERYVKYDQDKNVIYNSSIEEGCFSFKGKKKAANSEDYFSRETKSTSAKRRLDVCQMQWEEFSIQIQILQTDLNSKIFDDLLAFVKLSQFHFTLEEHQGSHRLPIQEIPTAAVITGVNTPDHGVMFAALVLQLKDRVSPLVARLKSKDCPSIKAVLSQTIGQFLQNPDLLTDDDDLDAYKKRLPCTMFSLSAWYREKYKIEGSSPKKQRSNSGDDAASNAYPPLIVLFEDLEAFSPKVLQDFIIICSNYLQQLPLVLVFGIATAVTAVHRLLPSSVSSLLCMEKFQAPPSSEYLTQVISQVMLATDDAVVNSASPHNVINQVLMTPAFSFKLGPNVFELLLDMFLYHDFSVMNFVRGLQLSVLEHFSSQPLSYLCCLPADVSGQVKKMNHIDLEEFRKTPSFMRYVEKCPQLQTGLLLEDKILKDTIVQLIQDVHSYHVHFFPILQCLHVLVSKLPHHPLGKQLREMYIVCLEDHVVINNGYKEAMDMLRFTSKDELVSLILLCVEKLKCPDASADILTVVEGLKAFQTRFESLQNEPASESDEDYPDPTEADILPKKTDLHNLRKKLKEIGAKKKKMSPYEKLRLKSIDYFHEMFRKFLVCPSSLPLHEIFYFDKASEVKQHINASPRAAIQTALSRPHCYLECQCCAGDPGTILPSMPDVCIVYKLHLECGRLINLYDLLQAFAAIVNESGDSSPSKTPDKLMQARFIRAVSELQFLGFVKPTKKKTDHVMRLTWGGC